MLIDFVSDLRAPTPTGAAEFAVPVKSELEARLLTLQSRLVSAGSRYLQERRSLLDGLKRGIPNLKQILFENMQKLDDRSERLRIGFKNYLENRQNRLNLNEIKPFYITNILDKKNETLAKPRPSAGVRFGRSGLEKRFCLDQKRTAENRLQRGRSAQKRQSRNRICRRRGQSPADSEEK